MSLTNSISACLSADHDGERCKMAEPVETSLALCTARGSRCYVRPGTLTATVTESVALSAAYWHITEQSSVCIPVSVDRLEQKCFQLTIKSSGRPQQLQLCRQPSCSMLVVRRQRKPVRRRVRGTTRSPDDQARRADRASTSATDVSLSGNTTANPSDLPVVDILDLNNNGKQRCGLATSTVET